MVQGFRFPRCHPTFPRGNRVLRVRIPLLASVSLRPIRFRGLRCRVSPLARLTHVGQAVGFHPVTEVLVHPARLVRVGPTEESQARVTIHRPLRAVVTTNPSQESICPVRLTMSSHVTLKLSKTRSVPRRCIMGLCLGLGSRKVGCFSRVSVAPRV